MGQKLLTERVNSARTRSLGLWQEGLVWLRRSLRAQERRDHRNITETGPRQAETFRVLSVFWVSIWWGKFAILAVTKQVESVCGAHVFQALLCFPHFRCLPSERLSQITTMLRWKGGRYCKEQQSSCNHEYCLRSFIVPDPSLGTKDPVGKSDMSFICDRERQKTREISRQGKLDSEKPFWSWTKVVH